MNLLLYVILIFFTILVLTFLFIYFYLMDEPSITVFYRTIRRDIRYLYYYVKVILFLNYCRFRNLTIVDYFNLNVEKHPQNVCFVFEDEEWTYKEVDELSNKVAHCFLQEGYQKGDEVALLMENSPDYVCIWLGLAKIGVIPALINIKQRTESLAHSVNVIDIKGLIFGHNFSEALEKALPFFDEMNSATFYRYSRKSEKNLISFFPFVDLNVLLDEAPGFPVDEKTFKTNFSDKLLYMYTSGTTGLPKAAVITQKRSILCAANAKYVMGLNETQTIYNFLPLYHSSGGCLYLSFILVFGGKMVIRKKFSASNFWRDVVKYKVTTCVYIGEICRYLLSQPRVPEEFGHSLELMIGLGVKPHIWKEFQDRFGVKKIVEFYGSTEGNILLVNYEGKIGSIGFISRVFFKLHGIQLIKTHPESGGIMRNSNGVCIRCKPGEPGEVVGRNSHSKYSVNFDGYLNSEASKRKIIKNCFKKGDLAFISGDVLVMDEDGYVYFVDRCGDTFRWKGENVSTTEVENIISKILNLATCIVYGVKVPDSEGRIGMAAIQVHDLKIIDFEKLYKDIAERLPAYAIPAFIRISTHMELTGTYKLGKVSFREQGYNPEEINDPLYFLDTEKKAYVPLTREIYHSIISGGRKF